MEERRIGSKMLEKTSKFDLRRTHGGQIPTQIPFLHIETFRGDNMRRQCSRIKPCTTCCVSGCLYVTIVDGGLAGGLKGIKI